MTNFLFKFFLSGIWFCLVIPKKVGTKEVNAVIHEDYGEYTIFDFGSSQMLTRFKATIFNDKAADLAFLAKRYDKLSRVQINLAKVYNESGEQIYSLRKKDIVDRSNISSISVYEDDRIKSLDLKQNEFPYTIEYEVLEEFDHSFFIPNWYVYPGKRIEVEDSKFIIKTPEDLRPRHREFNITEGIYQESILDGHSIMSWDFPALEPLEEMFYGEKALRHLPIIYTSPSRFEYDGYKGDFSSWDDLAFWIHTLNKGRNDISDDLKNKMRLLTSSAKNDKDKISLIYDYLQKNTRYVSIQLGIGGFQPFLASSVENDGFGDCKALSFFAKSLLEAIGIESKYTLISAGKNYRPIIPDFPQSNFNHAILCVPNKGDTIWLECTNQTNPFGYLGTFTGNRKALLVDGGKGKIVNTITYNELTNITSNNIEVELFENGDAKLQEVTTYSGLSYENNGLNFYAHSNNSNQKEWIFKNSVFQDFNLLAYEVKLLEETPLPKAEIKVEYELNGFAKSSGKRLFVNLNPYYSYQNPSLRAMTLDGLDHFEVSKGETFELQVELNPPEGMRFEYLPKVSRFDSIFGSYEAELIDEEGRVYLRRKMVLKRGKFKSDQYNSYIQFINKINRADKLKLVLNKET